MLAITNGRRWLCGALVAALALGGCAELDVEDSLGDQTLAEKADDPDTVLALRKTGAVDWELSGAWQVTTRSGLDYRVVHVGGAGSATHTVTPGRLKRSYDFGLRLQSGHVDLVLRRDGKRDYLVRFESSRIRLIKREGGVDKLDAEHSFTLGTDTWRRVRVFDRGESIDLLIDGAHYLRATASAGYSAEAPLVFRTTAGIADLDLIETVPSWRQRQKDLLAEGRIATGHTVFAASPVSGAKMALVYRGVGGVALLDNETELRKHHGYTPADPVRVIPDLPSPAPRIATLATDAPPNRVLVHRGQPGTINLRGDGFLAPGETPAGCEYRALVHVFDNAPTEAQLLLTFDACVERPELSHALEIRVQLASKLGELAGKWGKARVVVERKADHEISAPVDIDIAPPWQGDKYLLSAVRGLHVNDDGEGARGWPEQHYAFAGGPKDRLLSLEFPGAGDAPFDDEETQPFAVQIPVWFSDARRLPETFGHAFTAAEIDGGSWGAIANALTTIAGAAIGGLATMSGSGIEKGAKIGEKVGGAIEKIIDEGDEFFGAHGAWFSAETTPFPYDIGKADAYVPFDSTFAHDNVDILTRNEYISDVPSMNEVQVTLESIKVTDGADSTSDSDLYGYARAGDALQLYQGGVAKVATHFGVQEVADGATWNLDLPLQDARSATAWPVPFVYVEIAVWDEDGGFNGGDDDIGGPITRLLLPQDYMQQSKPTVSFDGTRYTETYTYRETYESCEIDAHGACVEVTYRVQLVRNSNAPLANTVTHLKASGALSQGEQKAYTIHLPVGHAIRIDTTSADDIDLYLQEDAPATTSSYVMRGYTYSGNESLIYTPLKDVTLHIMVHGYEATPSFTLTTADI